MEIRIVKRPPAPKMDGFDMRGLAVGRVYVVDSRLGSYLVDAGYAVSATTKEEKNHEKDELQGN